MIVRDVCLSVAAIALLAVVCFTIGPIIRSLL